MNWAPVVSTSRAFVSLFMAAALVWSGIALTASPRTVDAAFANSSDSAAGLIIPEDDETKGDGNTASENGRDTRSSPVPANSGDPPPYFDGSATYRVLTRYGSSAEVVLADFLAEGVTAVSFSLHSCDDFRADYYDSATVQEGKLVLEPNTLGHVHGANTEAETVCTVTATDDNGSENREFSLYMVSDRTPPALLPGALTLSEARSSEIDIQISLPSASLGYLRVGWRKSGGQPSYGVVSGATDGMVLTIAGLEAETAYEVWASLMTTQAFDLFRASNTGSPGTLIQEGSPASKWISNLSSAGLGKSQALSVSTLPEPDPTPVPSPTPEATLAPTPRPTPDDDDDDDDDDGVDTPETDNDGIDTPLTDNDGIDTPLTDNDGVDTPLTDNDGVDTPDPVTPTPATPLTPTPEQVVRDLDPTPTPATPTPATPTPATPTPATPTPATPTPDTPTPATPTPATPTPATPTPATPTPATPTPATPTPATPTPATPTPATPTPATPTPDTPTPATPTPATPTPATPTPDTPTPDTPTPDTPTPDTPTPDTPTPDTPTPATPTPANAHAGYAHAGYAHAGYAHAGYAGYAGYA